MRTRVTRRTAVQNALDDVASPRVRPRAVRHKPSQGCVTLIRSVSRTARSLGGTNRTRPATTIVSRNPEPAGARRRAETHPMTSSPAGMDRSFVESKPAPSSWKNDTAPAGTGRHTLSLTTKTSTVAPEAGRPDAMFQRSDSAASVWIHSALVAFRQAAVLNRSSARHMTANFILVSIV